MNLSAAVGRLTDRAERLQQEPARQQSTIRTSQEWLQFSEQREAAPAGNGTNDSFLT